MQKPLSILFLVLLLSIQYGRTLNYLRCQVMRLASTAQIQCDCEKQFTDKFSDNPVDKDRPGAEPSTLKPRIEEPSTGADGTLRLAMLISGNVPADLPDPSVRVGFISPVFQPPRS